MARCSKPLIPLENKPKRKSKRGSFIVNTDTESKPTKQHFSKQQTKCAVCGETDSIAKPYLNTMGSVHPKCHDEVVTERLADKENEIEESAKRKGLSRCMICKKYAHKGDKTYVWSNEEIADGKFQGPVHMSCFEKLQNEQLAKKNEVQ